VLAVVGHEAAFAVKAATTTTATVFLVADDPAGLGLVASLPRPGGNMTGINIVNGEIAAKRMELLHVLVPHAAGVAVLINLSDTSSIEPQIRGAHRAATAMGLQIQVVSANSPPEIDDAFALLERKRPDALFVASSPFLNAQRVQLVQLAAFHRLRATYAQRDFVEAGGLMSYGSNIIDAYRQAGVYVGTHRCARRRRDLDQCRRAAGYVDRILKAEKPADLPVQAPTKYELVINLKTATMLGLTVPPTLLATADEVIE
jgi:putative ABC transport system substrate-binding protein